MRSKQKGKSSAATSISGADGSFQGGLAEFAELYEAKWRDAKVRDAVVNGIPTRRISSQSTLRRATGNHPKIYHHGQKQQHVVVLIHGITDSPHYMEAIGKQFHKMGFNVVLPLLPAHGLKDPWPAMKVLEHTDWVADVDRIVNTAAKLGDRVSMGGFSTGGALTVHKACREPKTITGGLFLFAPGLEIGHMQQHLLESEVGPLLGRIADRAKWARAIIRGKKERLKHQPPSRRGTYGIGANPYKYSVFFYEGASELAEVIEEINDHYERKRIKRYSDLTHPLFVAHSPIDKSAEFEGAKRIFDNHPAREKAFCDFCRVPHASLVLKEAIINDRKHPLYSPANRKFSQMMNMMKTFTRAHVI